MTIDDLRQWYRMTEKAGIGVVDVRVSHADYAMLIVELGSRLVLKREDGCDLLGVPVRPGGEPTLWLRADSQLDVARSRGA